MDPWLWRFGAYGTGTAADMSDQHWADVVGRVVSRENVMRNCRDSAGHSGRPYIHVVLWFVCLPFRPTALSLLQGSDYASFPVVTAVPSVELTQLFVEELNLKTGSSKQRGLTAQRSLNSQHYLKRVSVASWRWSLMRAASLITGVIDGARVPGNRLMALVKTMGLLFCFLW